MRKLGDKVYFFTRRERSITNAWRLSVREAGVLALDLAKEEGPTEVLGVSYDILNSCYEGSSAAGIELRRAAQARSIVEKLGELVGPEFSLGILPPGPEN